MSRQPRFVRIRRLAFVLAASAVLGGCGDDCPDVSGTWYLSAVCSGLDMPRPEKWEQDDCHVVRRSVAGEELGAVTLEDETLKVTHANTAAPCTGRIDGNEIEASCPSGVGQSCGPDTCCVMRWSR
jgi:hypothetical protein